jgi:hypothetical protein
VVRRVTTVEMIVVEGVSRAVWGGWTAVVVRIHCFGFGLRGDVTS